MDVETTLCAGWVSCNSRLSENCDSNLVSKIRIIIFLLCFIKKNSRIEPAKEYRVY